MHVYNVVMAYRDIASIQHDSVIQLSGALLAKMDIKHAFRLLLVHLADHHLLAMNWKGNLFIDTCLSFGLRSAPKLWQISYRGLDTGEEENITTYSLSGLMTSS